jgi:branched-chain amino acid transport system ATP-binding protein
MPLLEINDLNVRYGEIVALRGVSFNVEEGQVVTLLGANGAGKSTTLRAISGLAKPASGDILFDGKSIAGLGPEAIVRMGISHVPEGRRVFPGLTVKENIMLGGSNRKAQQGRIVCVKPTRCSTCFPTYGNSLVRSAGRCPVASCRWWRSRAA